MKNEKLKEILQRTDINKCIEVIENYIYYTKRPIRQRSYNGDGTYKYVEDKFEFLIVAENGEKQAIILRCGYEDLHWYVLKKWRNKHILSNALRTGIISKIWPENSKITCCYNYNDNHEQKYNMTKHLADIAGLHLE